MKAIVIKNRWNCAFTLPYVGKEISVRKCKSPHLKGLYKYNDVLFHKDELIF